MRRRQLAEVECCLNRKCIICAGLNRKIVFVEIEEHQYFRSRIRNHQQRKKELADRGTVLSAKDLALLQEMMKNPVLKVKLYEICDLSRKTVDKAVRGQKMFARTRHKIENAIRCLEDYIATSQDSTSKE